MLTSAFGLLSFTFVNVSNDVSLGTARSSGLGKVFSCTLVSPVYFTQNASIAPEPRG